MIALLKLPSGSFPILEVLKVQLDGNDDTFDGLTTIALKNIPKLRTLDLDAFGVCLAPDFLRFPFAQLTNLSLFNASTTPTDIHEVLEGCTSLLWAEFSVDEEISSTYEGEKIIVPSIYLSSYPLMSTGILVSFPWSFRHWEPSLLSIVQTSSRSFFHSHSSHARNVT